MSVLTLTDGTQVAEFELGFTLDAKAMDEKASVITSNDDGSLLIEGYASDFDVDRQGEAFEPGAFERGLQKYLTTNPILLYHHKSDTALGQVIDAKVDAKGMYIKARVDEPEPGTIVADYYRKIKNGTLRAFSVGGKFMRRMTEAGPRIFDVDLGEISVTPYPVNPRTLFAVAGKAFEGVDEETDLSTIEDALERIETAFDRFEGKASDNEGIYAVASLLRTAQATHDISKSIGENASDEEVKKIAVKIAADAESHAAKLHKLAAKIGPLPNLSGGVDY